MECQGTGIRADGEQVSIASSIIGRCGGDGVFLISEEIVHLTNCTSYLNGGAGFRINEGSSAEVTASNNIAFQNRGFGLVASTHGSTTSSCNDWFENTLGATEAVAPGPSDLFVDPRFCDVSQNDVHLQSGSSLANAAGCGLIGALGTCDLPTPVRVSLFRATRVPEGARVEWSVNAASIEGSLSLERAESHDGPWAAIASSIQPGGMTVDRGANPGQAYWYRLIESSNSRTRIVGELIPLAAVERAQFRLAPVSPDPVAGAATIRFSLARNSTVSLVVLDLQGRVVETLLAGVVGSGQHAMKWQPRLHAGMYLLRLRSDQGEEVRKVTVLD